MKHPDIREVIQIYCELFSFLDFSTENIKKHTQNKHIYMHHFRDKRLVYSIKITTFISHNHIPNMLDHTIRKIRTKLAEKERIIKKNFDTPVLWFFFLEIDAL